MSLGYAEKLSFIEDVGNVGMTEHFDPPHVLQEKVGGFSFLFAIHILALLNHLLCFYFACCLSLWFGGFNDLVALSYP
jgi:hypothetical protein